MVANPWLPEELIFEILTHFDVRTLVEKTIVCRTWQRLCTKVVTSKRTRPRKFRNNLELRNAIEQYCGYNKSTHSYTYCEADKAEELASTYGWPIGQWDVSHVKDFSDIFYHVPTFNDDIREWDVSNAEIMTSMFEGARCFNQDISSWNTSKVIIMDRMFFRATSFDQDVSTWNIPNVLRMTSMFKDATAYNERFPSSQIDVVPLKRQRVVSFHEQATTPDDDVHRAKNKKKNRIS